MLGECNFQANYDRLIRVIRLTSDGLITLIVTPSIGRSLLAAGEWRIMIMTVQRVILL